MRQKIVTFDIDGTLTIGHGWFYIASLLGKADEYLEYTAMFRSGRTGEAEHLSNLLSIAEGVPVLKIHSILRSVPKLRNLSAAVRMLSANGLETMLLTHNPQYVCEWYEKRFGFSDHGSAYQPVENGVVCRAGTLRPDKVAWLKQMCAERRISPRDVLHVGDSASDAAVFRATGSGIAVNSREGETTGSAAAAINTTDMKDVAKLILNGSE